MTAYCLDTEVISAVIKPAPDLGLVRRVAAVPAAEQFTTAVTVGELVYGATRRGSTQLAQRIEEIIRGVGTVLPFDERAARTYGRTRAELQRQGRPLPEPELRIASIALVHELVVVTGNVRHFARVPGLVVADWLNAS